MKPYLINSRRDFIKKMGAASLTAASTTIPMTSFLSSCVGAPVIPSSADTVILLWMAGGRNNRFATMAPNIGTGR